MSDSLLFMIRLDIELAEVDERPWAEDEADQEEWKPLSHFRSKQLFFYKPLLLTLCFCI